MDIAIGAGIVSFLSTLVGLDSFPDGPIIGVLSFTAAGALIGAYSTIFIKTALNW